MTAARALPLLAALALGACAERGVVSGPSEGTSVATGVTAGVAAALVVAVLSALLVSTAWRAGGARLAVGVLAVQASAAWLGTAVLTGVAVRGGQLVDRPVDSEQAASLLSLSGLDGREVAFFALMAGSVVVLGALVLALLVLTARAAASDRVAERAVATAVLAIEVLASLVAAGLVVAGDRGRAAVAAAAVLPVLLAATWSAWPPRHAVALTGTPAHGRVQRRDG